MSRNYVNTLLLESAMDSINTSDPLLWSVADTTMAPVVEITEEDCGTLLGESTLTDYDAEGLTELATGVPLSRSRINTLRSLGQTFVDVRSIRSCIAPGGLCRACYAASRPTPIANVPNFANVKLLMHAEGTVGAQTYTDSSLYHRTVLGPSTTVVDAFPVYRGSSSLHASGQVNLTARFTPGDKDEWARMGTDAHPMTLEMAIFFEGAAGVGPGSSDTGPGPGFWWGFTISDGGTSLDLYEDDPDPTASVPFLTPLVTGQYYAIAIQMTGSAHRVIHVWVNGIYQGTATSSRSPVTSNLVGATDDEASLDLGRANGGADFVGNLDEIRITEETFLPVGGNYSLETGQFPDANIISSAPAVGTKVKIYPEAFLQITQVSTPPAATAIPLEFSPEQYDFLYLYKNGLLLGPGDYTVVGKEAVLTAVPAPPPSLLLHFDGNFTDQTGNTTFTIGQTIGSGFFTQVSAVPTFTPSTPISFGQLAVVTANSGAPGASTVDMSIFNKPFTFEGVCRFETGETGGLLLTKNYFPSEPVLYNSDFILEVGPSKIGLSWGLDSLDVTFPSIIGQSFSWAVTDDMSVFRIFVNGELLFSHASVQLSTVPPIATAAQLTLFNALDGFSGSTPRWGPAWFRGRVDELRAFMGHALYDSPYTPSTAPFPNSSATEFEDYTVKYVVITRATFYYWLAATFAGSLLGVKPLPSRPLPLRKNLLLEAIPENDLEVLTDKLERSAAAGDFTRYLNQVKDPLEKAVFGVMLGSIFLNT